MKRIIDLKKQTIFIAVDQGFAARYLLRTDIFKVLKKSGARIVILTPNADEEYFVKEFADNNIFIEPINMKAYKEYSRDKVQTFLHQVRWFVMNGNMDLHTVNMRYNIHKNIRKKGTFKRKIYNFIFDICVFILRRSKILRQLEIKFESRFFTPTVHARLFKKYCPEKLLITSLGFFGHDHYLMREAKANGAKVISAILSWDNTSSKGMPGAIADHVIAWSETMKEELIGYSDVRPDKIFVGGIAHFDYHYQKENFWSREKFYSCFGLDPNRKTIFFAPKSPNKYPWNPDIVESIAKAIEEDRFIYPCQLLVRLHPLNFRVKDGDFRFKEDTAKHMALKERYKHLFYDIPEILSKKLPVDMPDSEMSKISTILNNADVMLSYFSTMMLEASIFNLPMINVAFYAHNMYLDKKDLQVVQSPHIRRILETSNILTAYNINELVDGVNTYLKDRELVAAGRKALWENECSYNAGNAGRNIGDFISQL
jgi:hypothetical protein